jgi:hypothetical protein
MLEVEVSLPPEGSLGSDRLTIEVNSLEAKLDQDAEPREELLSLSMLSMLANPTFLVLPFLAVSGAGQ